jgi:hypothetical protein
VLARAGIKKNNIMLRFNVLIPFSLLATLALLVVVYSVTGITGITVFVVVGSLFFLTER